jgi:hypothetical protein
VQLPETFPALLRAHVATRKKLPGAGANKTTLCQIPNMIINLSKLFHFRRDENDYKGVYVFKNNKSEDGRNDVCLVLTVSVNEKEEKEYQVNKPTATLFQSNELIEEMIADEVVAFSADSKR